MGSGSSSQAPKQNADTVKKEDNLPGSSVPPKGLPYQQNTGKSVVENGSKESRRISSTTTTTTVSGDKRKTSVSNGVKREKTDMRKKSANLPNLTVTADSSAHLRRNDTKNLVRKMEMGMEDEDDVDNILGLDRMKTKLQLKREKTRAKLTQPKGKFVQAAMKVQNKAKKYDGPRTDLDEIYMGNVNVECPSTAKVVRIFTSSTFTDTMHERNTLMENAYPKLKSFCQELGYEFQVVDMRWGVRDEAADDHMTTEICLKELEMCKKLSTGPNFVSLMSHKYGYSDFPRCIDADKYEEMLEHIDSKEMLELLNKWYSKDTNALPPVYVVHPISFHIPDFVSQDKDKKNAARTQWWSESEAIQAALEEVAQKRFDTETARKYMRSVTETEVYGGIINADDINNTCIWLKRTIEDIETKDSSYILSRYIECTYNNSEDKVKKSQELLNQLKNKIEQKLPVENILDYKVTWNKEKGIDPNSEEHRKYLVKLCDDFVSKMCSMIHAAVQAKKRADGPLIEEIVQHIQFSQDKCRQFHGRDDVFKQIKRYVQGMSNEPMVLYGPSGCGKTSIMAMAAKQCAEWTNNKAAVVFRFIGTTPDSTDLISFLSSITSQIRHVYGLEMPVSKDLRTLTDEFQVSLFLASSDRPLVLIFDSLDMMNPSHNARQLYWLPARLRPNVKIIVSTLPDNQFESLPVLQSTVRTKDNFIQVPALTVTDLSEIIDKWLVLKQRQLTPEQKKIVTTMCSKCPLPLYLKLSFDKASVWTSCLTKAVTVLEPTVRQSIDGLFQRLEKLHGQMFVSRALGYLTLARAGLTETELEDVLSCDDDVLNDVYMYWTPPIRRLPPLLLIRIRSDLAQYLVDRSADGVRVMSWYHRQFMEAAENRYCNDVTLNEKLHASLADFFSGRWANGHQKPYTSSKGEKGTADRHVALQPNKFGHSYNIRKLNNLPFHRCKAKQCDVLKKESLCNFEFLLDKLKATSLWILMDDFTMAKEYFPQDELLNSINDVLRLAQVGLLYDPHQIVPQFLGRLPNNKSTEEFIKKCSAFPLPCILPDKTILTQPGGQLIHSMAGHKGDILSLDLTADGLTALTCSDDGSIRMWNVESGQQVHLFDGLGKVSRARFCHYDNCILIDMNKKLAIRSSKTGEKVFDMNSVTDDCPSCLCGDNKSLLVVFKDNSALVYDLEDGVQKSSVQLSEEFQFKFPGFATGSKNFAAVTTSDQIYLTLFDLKKNEFLPLFRGFEPFQDQDIGEEVQYEIDEMTITADEKYVVYSNIYSNDIVFLDFRAKKKAKIIKGNPDDYMRSLKCSSDGKSLYFVKGAFVNFFETKSSKSSEELEHNVDIISVCTNNMKTIVTTAEDSNVRVWDRTKRAQKISQTPGKNANRIRLLQTHPNGRYVIGFGFRTKENDSQFLFVYDLLKHCIVREKSLDCSIFHMELLNDKELLIVHDVFQKIKTVNIETLQVTKEFQGFLPSKNWKFNLIGNKNEVACLSCGRHNVKIYNTQTGKTSAILETRHQSKLDGLCVSKDGKTLATWCDETGDVFVFDLGSKKLLHKIKSSKTAMFEEEQIMLSPDSKFLLFKVEEKPTIDGDSVPAKSRKDDEVIYIEVWDPQKGVKVSDLMDMEYYNKYNSEKERTGNSSSVDTFEILDNKTVLVAHDDFILRVFDIASGNILHRLFRSYNLH
ncbi:NACHT domain- and WD repeat-containing protein 1-like isoform X3 [Ruditapes philippinarum]|uniref:NACHT domain- and WD repeat-containing protein 1-like isoform X3 n=1 Tax=Ruditapes philippinarum TaxID=129788 RepID=UPI00295A858E|nr:NACHT domain- and WD repeat-containing protein 1-like isoform X3 [Ruditapes philippinarum]